MANVYGKYAFFKAAVQTGTVTITNPTGGTITASKVSGNEGDTITLSISLSSNYYLSSYTVNGTAISGSSFTLKAGENTVTASVYYSAPVDPTPSVTYYTLTVKYVDSSGSTLATSDTYSIASGTTVTPSDYDASVSSYNVSSRSPSSSFTMYYNKTITITYTKVTPALTASIDITYDVTREPDTSFFKNWYVSIRNPNDVPVSYSGSDSDNNSFSGTLGDHETIQVAHNTISESYGSDNVSASVTFSASGYISGSASDSKSI